MYRYCMNQVARQDAEIGEYECQAILGFKIVEGKRRYLIKWRGFPARFNSWEPLHNLFAISDYLLNFQKQQRSLVKEKENEWSSLYLSGQVNQPLDYSQIPVIKKEADRIKRAEAWLREQSLDNKPKEQSLDNKPKEQILENSKSARSKPIKKKVFPKKREAAVKRKKRKTFKTLGRPRKQKVESKSDDLYIPQEDPQYIQEEQGGEEEQMIEESPPNFEENRKPAFEEEPAPAFEEQPAPALEEELAPALEEEPASALEEELAPAVSVSSELYSQKDLGQVEERKEDGDKENMLAEEKTVKVKVEDPAQEADNQEINDEEQERASSSISNHCNHCAFAQHTGDKPVKREQSQQKGSLQMPTEQKKNIIDQNEDEDKQLESRSQYPKQLFSDQKSKESSINLGEVLKGIISLNEVKGQKPTLSRVEQIHMVHGERVCEVEVVEKRGVFVRRFISYELLREYYSKPLLIFLERSGRILI